MSLNGHVGDGRDASGRPGDGRTTPGRAPGARPRTGRLTDEPGTGDRTAGEAPGAGRATDELGTGGRTPYGPQQAGQVTDEPQPDSPTPPGPPRAVRGASDGPPPPAHSSHGHLVAPLGSAIAVGSFPLDGGEWFARHEHGAHQLAWAPHGVLAVQAAGRTWVLPSTVALWIPAGVPHATGATSAALLRSLYFWPDRCPVSWDEPQVVAVSGLLRELIGHLAQGADRIPADARLRAESVVLDLLRPVSVTTVRAPDPTDPRARRVAEALRADPSDGRTLTEWGAVVGASARTLARAFVSGTGLTYGQWRAQLRLQAAMPLLAAGATVSSVARRVGYGSPSAFVAAFRRGVGVAPGTYFARAGGEGVGR